jgi:hypothetical protein
MVKQKKKFRFEIPVCELDVVRLDKKEVPTNE